MTIFKAGAVALAFVACVAAGPALDGAQIVNSGSTNTASWTLLVRSDGSGSYTLGRRGMAATSGATPTSVKIDPALVRKLIADAKSAQAAGAAGGSCMKSASFGSTTVVRYHNWHSPDLQCPPSSGLLVTLAADSRNIQQAAGIGNFPKRVGLPPNEMRRQPETTNPSPAATPSHRTIREHA